MSRGHSRVQDVYDMLRAEPVTEGESAVAELGPSGRLRDALLVKDHVGLFHLMTMLPPGREPFDVAVGKLLRTAWVDTQEDGRTEDWLDVVCIDARLLRTFLSLIGEMLDRSDASGRACIDELTEVLESWRAVLARERSAMDRNRVVGIFGELTVLERLARRDPQAALNAWLGRRGAPHDFVRTNALEVKTLLRDDTPVVTIHGETQLDPPLGGDLHLVAFRIADSSEGESIEDLADKVAAHGVPREEIFRTLGDDSPGSEDRQRRFVIEEARLHSVTEDFPGIRSFRLDPAILRGVSGITYQLDLDSCPGELDPDQLDDVLREL